MYQELLKNHNNSSCVCTHLANKADSDSDIHLILMSEFLKHPHFLSDNPSNNGSS